MPQYGNELTAPPLTYPDTAETSSEAKELDRTYRTYWPLQVALQSLAGAAMDGTLNDGFAVSDAGGLGISVAAGSGLIGGWTIYAAGATAKTLLDNSTLYIFLKRTATTDADRTFTVEQSLLTTMADAIMIAKVVTAAGDITSIDNTPTSRTPRLPLGYQLYGHRFVGPAGSGMPYTDLKTAVESCNAGDIVVVCPGAHTCAAEINVAASNLTILGASREGVILDFTAGDATHCFDLNGYDGIRIAELTIQAAAAKTGAGIYSSGSDDVFVHRVKFTGFGTNGKAVYGLSGNRWRVESCYADIDSRYGIWLDAVPDSIITANFLKLDGISSSVSIAVYLNACDRSLLSLNRLRATAANTSKIIQVLNPNYISIMGNTLLMDDPLAAGIILSLHAYTASGIGNKIANNILILNPNDGYGIGLTAEVGFVLDETDVSANAVINGARGVSVTDVRCTDTLVHGNKVATCTAGVSDGGTNTAQADQD